MKQRVVISVIVAICLVIAGIAIGGRSASAVVPSKEFRAVDPSPDQAAIRFAAVEDTHGTTRLAKPTAITGLRRSSLDADASQESIATGSSFVLYPPCQACKSGSGPYSRFTLCWDCCEDPPCAGATCEQDCGIALGGCDICCDSDIGCLGACQETYDECIECCGS